MSGRNYHRENHEKVPEVSWRRGKLTRKIWYYDMRHGKDHNTAIAYSLDQHNGYLALYDTNDKLIDKACPSIVFCQSILRSRLK